MRTFDYVRPTDIDDALAELARPDTVALAGGTNLVDLMRLGVQRPARVVDIGRLDFGGITVLDGGALRIGAGVRNADLAADPVVRSRFPLISRAILAGASGQIRNVASTAGNLLQRTRCTYFNDPSKPCNKREPGSGCPAQDGLSRELAVLGGSSSCIATHPGDLAVALTALDAVVHLRSAGSEQADAVPITRFYRLPGDSPHVETVLPAGALITAVEVPTTSAGTTVAYRKARDRRSFAFALASIAAAVVIDDGTVTSARVAFGGVAPVPWRAVLAEQVLQGAPATSATFAAAADAELVAAQPTADNAFKVPLLRRLLVGVLTDLAEAAGTDVDDLDGGAS